MKKIERKKNEVKKYPVGKRCRTEKCNHSYINATRIDTPEGEEGLVKNMSYWDINMFASAVNERS